MAMIASPGRRRRRPAHGEARAHPDSEGTHVRRVGRQLARCRAFPFERLGFVLVGLLVVGDCGGVHGVCFCSRRMPDFLFFDLLRSADAYPLAAQRVKPDTHGHSRSVGFDARERGVRWTPVAEGRNNAMRSALRVARSRSFRAAPGSSPHARGTRMFVFCQVLASGTRW